MKNKTLKTIKISILVFIAALTGTLPVTSMAHNNGQNQADILLHLLPLLNSHHVHQHYDYKYRHHYPRKIKHQHQHPGRRYGHVRNHHSEPVVRSHDHYSNNKIIKKHFK